MKGETAGVAVSPYLENTMPLIRTQQTQSGYNIHPVDIPADHVRHERPLRIPTFEIDVLGVTVLCTVLAGMLFGALFNSVRVGIGCGGGFGLLVAIWRVWSMLSDPLYETKETTFQRVRTDVAPGNRTIPVYQNGERRDNVPLRNPKTLSGGGREYVFEGYQLDRMLDWYNQGYDSIRRDTSALGPGLAEIGINGVNFAVVKELFQFHGIVGQDSKWTRAGLDWLKKP